MPFIERDGGSIHYDHIDLTLPWIKDAPTMVFVHGVGANVETWSEWLPHLVDRVKILRVDLRGHGKSSHPGADHVLSFDSLSADVIAVIEAVGASRIILAGESIGGTTVLYMAAHKLVDPLAIVTCSTAHRGNNLENVNAWRTTFAEQGFEAWSRDMMDRRFTDGVISQDKWDWYFKTQTASDGGTILALGDLLIHADLTEKLPAITAPTLLMAPASSPFIPIDVPRTLVKLLPEAELKEYSGMRHAIVFSHAEDCAATAQEFLERKGVI